ncbi:MAG: RIP metalloprotease RseP [Acidobacteriota bacterium]
MFTIGTDILALAFVLGVMIFVHEFGHFGVAKLFGIRVEVFALGFGPRLFGFQRGQTDYRVCALPLGGYVKMKGENPDEVLTGDGDEYLTRPKWQRFLVLVMGPSMNVVLSIVLFTTVFLGGIEVEAWTEQPVQIGWIEKDSPAAGVELLPGDRVIAVDGEPLEAWREFTLREAISGGQPMTLTVIRNGVTQTVQVTPLALPPSDQGYLGIRPAFPPIVDSVAPGGPAADAGIEPGDRFVEVEGEPIQDFSQLQKLIAARAEMPTEIVLDRNGQELTLHVTPRRQPRELGGVGYLGLSRPLDTVVHHFGPVAAVGQAVAEARRQASLVGQILARIFTGRMSVRTLSGPIEIAKFSGAAASTGNPRVLLWFMAVVSLQLGLLNLLPIPVLDGGHIAVLAFEGLIRRDLSMRVKERMMTVGLILLMTLMAVVITFDVLKSLPPGWTGYWPF